MEMAPLNIQEIEDDNLGEERGEPRSPSTTSTDAPTPIETGAVAIVESVNQMGMSNLADQALKVTGEVQKKYLEKDNALIHSVKEMLNQIPEENRMLVVGMVLATLTMITIIQPNVAVLAVGVGLGGYIYSLYSPKSINQEVLQVQTNYTQTIEKMVANESKIRQEITKVKQEPLTKLNEVHIRAQQSCMNKMIDANKEVQLAEDKTDRDVNMAKIQREVEMGKMAEQLRGEQNRREAETERAIDNNKKEVSLKLVQMKTDVAKVNADCEVRLREIEKEEKVSGQNVDGEVEKSKHLAEERVEKIKSDNQAQVDVVNAAADAFKSCGSSGRPAKVQVGALSATKG